MPNYSAEHARAGIRTQLPRLETWPNQFPGYENRNLGIFYENAVNRILRDIVEATRPEWCMVRGEFTPRGGLTTTVEAQFERSGGSRGTHRPRRSARGAEA